MTSDNPNARALEVYERVKGALSGAGIAFTSDAEKRTVSPAVPGMEGAFELEYYVSEVHETLLLTAHLPCKMPEQRRIDGALAIACANTCIVNGSFKYELGDGSVFFCVAVSYASLGLTSGAVLDMIRQATQAVDRFGISLFRLANGFISLEAFLNSYT